MEKNLPYFVKFVTHSSAYRITLPSILKPSTGFSRQWWGKFLVETCNYFTLVFVMSITIFQKMCALGCFATIFLKYWLVIIYRRFSIIYICLKIIWFQSFITSRTRQWSLYMARVFSIGFLVDGLALLDKMASLHVILFCLSIYLHGTKALGGPGLFPNACQLSRLWGFIKDSTSSNNDRTTEMYNNSRRSSNSRHARSNVGRIWILHRHMLCISWGHIEHLSVDL